METCAFILILCHKNYDNNIVHKFYCNFKFTPSLFCAVNTRKSCTRFRLCNNWTNNAHGVLLIVHCTQIQIHLLYYPLSTDQAYIHPKRSYRLFWNLHLLVLLVITDALRESFSEFIYLRVETVLNLRTGYHVYTFFHSFRSLCRSQYSIIIPIEVCYVNEYNKNKNRDVCVLFWK